MPKGRKHHDRITAAAAEIVRRLQETEVTVSSLMDEYGCAYATLKRAILTRITPKEYRILACRRLARGGVATRFRPGDRPWNCGRKGRRTSPATEFQRGCIRGNAARKYRAVGTITIRQGKRLSHRKNALRGQSSRWIKIRDEGRSQNRYVPYARWLWERAHGPVPRGCFVVHRDNDRMNDSLDNLIIVDRRRHMERLYERPAVIAKCRARAAQAARKRHGERRMVHRSRRLREFGTLVWECHACGGEFAERPARCSKCGGTTLERREISDRSSGK
jgi:hypothetical protein